MKPFQLSVLSILLTASPAFALDYVNDIQAILKQHCWECHSSEKEVKGDLALDNLNDMAKIHIADIGSIRPGDPEKSDLLARLKLSDKDDDFMPRKGKPVPKGDLRKIEQWILEGAVMDATQLTEAEKSRMDAVKIKAARNGADIYFLWSSTDGKTVEAKFLQLQGESVKMITEKGRVFLVPFSLLSPESIELAKKLGSH